MQLDRATLKMAARRQLKVAKKFVILSKPGASRVLKLLYETPGPDRITNKVS